MQFVKRLGLTVAVALVCLSAQAAWADGTISLFVGRTNLPAVVRAGKVYVSAEAMLRAMGYAWSDQADGYVLREGTPGGPQIAGRLFNLRLGKRTASPQTIVVNGKIWMDARTTTEGLGGIFVYTPAAGMAQATFPQTKVSKADLDRAVREVAAESKREAQERRKAQSSTAWRSGSSGDSSSSGDDEDSDSSDSSGGEKTKTTEGAAPGEDEPVAVDRVTFSTAGTGLMRGTIVLKNDADKAVRNILVYITMMAPDEPGKSTASANTGAGGTASLPGYVQTNKNDDTLPTYGGTPPTSVSSSYPSAAPVSSASATSTYTAPTPTPAAPAAEASPSPEATASPTPVPMHPVATLPALFVAEIEPGQTLSIPFQWMNSQGIAQVSPSVQTQHDKVEFTRKKAEPEEDEDKKDKDDESGEEAKDKADDAEDEEEADKAEAGEKSDKSDKGDKGDGKASKDDKSKSDDTKDKGGKSGDTKTGDNKDKSK